MHLITDIRDFQAVITLAEELNFTRAAAKLGVTQSGLTKTIQRVEKHVNVKLFNRDRKRVELTESGAAFAAEAKVADGRQLELPVNDN